MELIVDDDSSKRVLATELEKPLRNGYAAVRVLLLYWKEDSKMAAYKDEAKRLKKFFDELQYETEVYEIPTEDSHGQTFDLIHMERKNMQQRMNVLSEPCLLIIHYGGHGDKNDGKDLQGRLEERRSVWRGDYDDKQVVHWYFIQQLFIGITFDVLLLLDCCYAATAGRGGLEIADEFLPPGRVELLAAAADRVGTPEPGGSSFTSKMLKNMEELLQKRGHVHIEELTSVLTHRKADIYTTPCHVALRIGPVKRSITLKKLGLARQESDGEMMWRSTVSLCIRMHEPLTPALVRELISWLHTDAPTSIVAGLQVERIFNETEDLRQFLSVALPDHSSAVVRTLNHNILARVGTAWDKLQLVVSDYRSQRTRLSAAHDRGFLYELGTRFIEQIRESNSQIRRLIHRGVLTSPAMSDPFTLNAVIQDPVSDLIRLKEHLVLRHTILVMDGEHSSTATGSLNIPSLTPPASCGLLQEYKIYGREKTTAEIEVITSRISMLATVMKAHKPSSFCCLELHDWKHDPFEHRFEYRFLIKAETQKMYITLYEALKLKDGLRPTLHERLNMARDLTEAVEQWHSVGWVHQSISAYNVLFFKSQDDERYRFDAPILQGFEFSRPDGLPSTDLYVENLATDIYRHPDRQGVCRKGHTKIHDLYSLGVVLLEIGLWRPAWASLQSHVERKERKLIPQRGSDQKATKGRTKETMIQEARIEVTEMVTCLRDAARIGLAHYVGTPYQEAVLTCLTSEFGIDELDMSERNLSEARERLILRKLEPLYDA